MNKEEVHIGPYAVEITHREKVLFPDDGITKGEFIDYHRQIADVMVPYIKGRPIIMHRFPDGIKSENFYQQNAEHLPDWVHRVSVKKEGGTVTHIVCDNAASLVYIANQACITPHIWLSRMDKPENPDLMIFDLDPPGEDFEAVRYGAKYLKRILDNIGLHSYLKTTGSHGLHIVVPLTRTHTYEKVRSFAQEVADVMTGREPEQFTTEQRKEKRHNRLFIDTLRNAYAHTAVAPYAVRAKKGAPIAAPLFWEELEEAGLNAQRYNIGNIFKRLEKSGDPWKDIQHHAQSLSRFHPRLKEDVPNNIV